MPAANGSHTLASGDDNCCSSKVVTLKIAQDQNKESAVQLQLAAPDTFVALLPHLCLNSIYRFLLRSDPAGLPVQRSARTMAEHTAL